MRGRPDRHQDKQLALALAFEGRWTHAEMAEQVGVCARTIERWLATPDFQTRLAALRSDLAASLCDVAYADKSRRIIALNQMAESARREYEARPLLIERRPAGRDLETGEVQWLEQEAFNRDAHAAFREALNDIAKELGERSNNVHITTQQQTLGITIVLERMRGDSTLIEQAAEFVGLVDGPGQAEE